MIMKNLLLKMKVLYQRKAENAREGMKLYAKETKLNKNITYITFNLMKTLATPIV